MRALPGRSKKAEATISELLGIDDFYQRLKPLGETECPSIHARLLSLQIVQKSKT